MSSKVVRDSFNTWIAANSAEANIVDLTAMYKELNETLTDAGITRNIPWVGLQFIGSNEEATSLYANNTNGCYREFGSIFIHVVDRVKSTIYDDLLTRCETLRNLLRGQRIDDIVVQGVTPPNFESGATLQLEAGYQSASITINFYRDNNL